MPEKVNLCGGLGGEGVRSKGGGSPHATSFDNVVDFGNLLDSAKSCCKGVRWKQSTQNFEMDMLINVAKIQKELVNGKFKSKGFKTFYIKERGKTRKIQAVHITERVVQKALCKYVLKPVIEPKLIAGNGATIKGKGTHYTIDRIKSDLRKAYRLYGNNFYVLKMDFHNYFGSIRHDIILGMVRPLIDCKSFKLLEHFVRNFDGDAGIGLGSEVSQILAIFYLNPLDHYIKEHFHIKGYERYMDDLLLISPNKELLFQVVEFTTEYANKRGNSLNKSKTMVSRPRFVFLKKRFLVGKKIGVKVGRRSITAARRKIKKVKDKQQVQWILNAWNGLVSNLNAHNATSNLINLAKEVL